MTICLLLYIIVFGMLNISIIIILCGNNAQNDCDSFKSYNILLLLFPVLCFVSEDINCGVDLSR